MASHLRRSQISEIKLLFISNGTLSFVLLFAELPTIILQNQVPKGMKKSEALMQMEATIKKYTSEIFLTEDDLYDVEKNQPPR
jgi:predicted ribonuclease toxin of YeeF-YezG toxin-antitoxin module